MLEKISFIILLYPTAEFVDSTINLSLVILSNWRAKRTRRHEASLETHLTSYLSKPTMSLSLSRLRFVISTSVYLPKFLPFLLILSLSPYSFTLLMMVLLYLTALFICILSHPLFNEIWGSHVKLKKHYPHCYFPF